MGFHSFLQARGLPFEGAMAKSWNLRIFKHINAQVNEASMMLAHERGPCPDAADLVVNSAGIVSGGLLSDVPMEEWRRLHEVNVLEIGRASCRERVCQYV